MMTVSSIENGIVLDHIKAGKAMELYKALGLDELPCLVAIITNAYSNKMGRKDIIKIDAEIELNLDIIGYIDPNITVNVIKNGVNTKQPKIEPPERIEGLIKCKNPRCITSVEQELPNIFKLTDRKNMVYRCIYCESAAK